MERVHFPGLNGLRFLAALAVILGHIELIKLDYGIYNFKKAIPFFEQTAGHQGVILFFVLSGFLITYLLLAEKGKYGKVAVKKFYIRRVLRIWPLYFLLLLIVFLLFPVISKDTESYAFFKSDHIVISLVLYIFFLPNMAFQLGIWAPLGAHLWSIGVEEQFYLSWPVLVNTFRKRILLILVLIFLGVSLIPHAAGFILNHFSFNTGLSIFIKQFALFFQIAKFNSMAIGGIFAWLYFEKKEKILKILNNHIIEVIAIVLGFGLWLLGFVTPYFCDEFYSLLFGIIILNVATSPKPILRLDNWLFNYLGKISYGLYMFHWLAIVLIIYCIRAVAPSLELQENAVFYNLLMYPNAIMMTIGLSSLSYELYERKFLEFKKKFTKIASG